LITTHDFMNYLLKTRLGEVYSNVFIALRVMLICTVTVANAERSFNKLKLTKPSKDLLWQIADYPHWPYCQSMLHVCAL